MPIIESSLTMRQMVSLEHTVDSEGIIRDAGKFLGEPWYAALVYQWMLDGDSSEIIGNANVFSLTDRDRRELELDSTALYMLLEISELGFVYTSTLDQSELDEIVEEEESSDEFGDE